MIHRIVIENFFSIADQQEMIFGVSKKTPELPCFRSSQGDVKERLPLVIGFYGPNASGKSTILRSLNSAAWFVRQSFTLQPNTAIPLFHPYMHKDWWNRPTKIIIDYDGRITPNADPSPFRYELHLTNEFPVSGKEVAYESLSFAPNRKFRRVFVRTGQDFEFGREFEITASDTRVKSIRPNASVISTLAQLNHKISSDLLFALQSLQTNISGLDKSQPLLNYALGYYLQHPAYLEKLNSELSRLDLGLEEMKIIAGNVGPVATFRHIGLDNEIILALESAGTKKFIEIFPSLQYVLETGGLAVIDELDNDIHALLLPEIFRWFYDKERNKYGAQLIFSAHNPSILDDFEKEQIYFAEKLTGKPTRVYGAREIEGLRREPSLAKKYLSGVLGAVPHLG